jgi:hypothetical protein
VIAMNRLDRAGRRMVRGATAEALRRRVARG